MLPRRFADILSLTALLAWPNVNHRDSQLGNVALSQLAGACEERCRIRSGGGGTTQSLWLLSIISAAARGVGRGLLCRSLGRLQPPLPPVKPRSHTGRPLVEGAAAVGRAAAAGQLGSALLDLEAVIVGQLLQVPPGVVMKTAYGSHIGSCLETGRLTQPGLAAEGRHQKSSSDQPQRCRQKEMAR